MIVTRSELSSCATTECFSMTRANEAIEKVKKNKVRYRAVLAN